MLNEPEVGDGGWTVCAVVRARPGQAAALKAYEDAVLALVPEHRGVIVARLGRSVGSAADAPDEVHVLTFPSRRDFEAFRDDPRRAALAEQRQHVVEQADVHAYEILTSACVTR
jgi:uncharacterized protein (DUF1330 family)